MIFMSKSVKPKFSDLTALNTTLYIVDMHIGFVNYHIWSKLCINIPNGKRKQTQSAFATVVINLIIFQMQTVCQLPELVFKIFAMWVPSKDKNHI